jgi:hypothetical protein
MAYMNQEKKQSKMPLLQGLFKEYRIKASVSVDNHSSLVVSIASGKIDFIKNYNENLKNDRINGIEREFCNEKTDYLQVNTYWLEESFSGIALEFLLKLKEIMMQGNHDRSDIGSDYFDVGWYISINIGKYNKPYEYII